MNTAELFFAIISTLLCGVIGAGCHGPTSGDILLRAAKLEKAGEARSACRMYWRAVSRTRLEHDDRFRARRALVRCAHGLGHLGAVTAWAQALLARNPKDSLAHYTLAMIALRSPGGRLSEALAHLRVSAQRSPSQAEIPYRMGRALLVAAQPAEAVRELERAVSLRKRWAPPRVALARAYAQLGKYAMARRVLVPLPECSPTARQVQEASETISAMARLADPVPPMARPFMARAMALLENDFTAAAATVLRSACQKHPQVASFWLLYGLAAIRLSSYGAAIGRLKIAARLNPMDPAPPLHLAEVYASLGRRTDAVGMFRRARRLNPVSRRAHAGLGRVLLQLKRFQEAVPMLRRAAALAGRSTPALLSLGKALVRAGRLGEAQRVLTRAARYERSGVTARLALAELLVKRYRSARDEKTAERTFRRVKALLEKILQLQPDNGRARALRRKLLGSTGAIRPRPTR